MTSTASDRREAADSVRTAGPLRLTARVFYGVFGCMLGIAATAALIGSRVATGAWTDGVMFIIYMISATALALIVGLIFGVPRARDSFVAGATERYSANSNLEQISDWLTKLLVGVGLVQLSQAPRIVDALGTYLARGMQMPNAAGFSVAAVLYGCSIGFLAGYLWSRLRMRQYLEDSDRVAAEASMVRSLRVSLKRQNEEHAQAESESDIGRAAKAAVRARESVGRHGSIAPILWVDDVPQNNRVIIDSLKALDIEIELCDSTTTALAAFDRRSFGLIISDLGRSEASGYNDLAGVDLIEQIRQRDRDVPIIIYGTYRATRLTDELVTKGATLVTNRASVLLEAATRIVTASAA